MKPSTTLMPTAPLAAYYFGTDKSEEETFLHHTTSGGVASMM